MNCPHCRKSLWVDYPVCPHCKQAIQWTPGAPAAQDPAPAEWVTVKKCATLGEADALRSQLQAEGIAVLLPDEMAMQANPVDGMSQGFPRVQVWTAQWQEARELLASLSPEGAPRDEAEIARASVPLSEGMKWAAFTMGLFICAGIAPFALAKASYARQGCERKEEQLWHWFAGGAVSASAAVALFAAVRALMA